MPTALPDGTQRSAHGCSIRCGPGAFWGQLGTLSPWSCSSAGSWAVVVVWGHTSSCCVIRSVCAMSFEQQPQIVRVKWHPHECSDKGFPSRTWHWGSISISLTVNGLNVVAASTQLCGSSNASYNKPVCLPWQKAVVYNDWHAPLSCFLEDI